MASLLGKADTGIISAARSEARADKPADLTSLYERKADKFDDFLSMIGEAFDMQTKKEKEKGAELDKNQEAANDAYIAGNVNEHYEKVAFDAVNGAVKAVKDFKGDKNSLEYKILNRRVNRLAEMSEFNLEEFKTLLSTQISSNLVKTNE